MLVVIVLLPLISFLAGGLLGRWFGQYVCYITILNMIISFFLSIFLLFNIINFGGIYKIELGSWIIIDVLDIKWSLIYDSLVGVMLIVVTCISTLVHIYSLEYMKSDPHLIRFMSYLSLFTFFMLILVTSNNFLQMFIGWEGVGLSSYLLINFWFTRIQANKAAIKAMLINRIGDFALLIALFSIYTTFESFDYDIIFSLAPYIQNYKLIFYSFEISIIDIICLFLFLGCMGKSAQLGLHTWLPDAMEGPTPVSALIHAATMVTAGVFLIARCSYLFEFSSISLSFIVIVGSLTSIFAATTGLFQNDLKKVIAYSTCSQLGYMIFACGLSSYDVGIFHLSNHAFFKALLFLSAGSIIHSVSDEQDMRKMGGLQKILPLSYASVLIGSLALTGFPFLTGFYSKDTILEIAFSKFSFLGHFSFFLGSIAAFFTAFYSMRLLFLVFLTKPGGSKSIILKANESDWYIKSALIILIFFSIFIGFFSKDLFIGFGTNFWGSSIFILPQNYSLVDIEFLSIKFKLIPLILSVLGLFLAYYIYCYKLDNIFYFKQTFIFKLLYNFFNRKWFFDKLYNSFFGQKVLFLGFNFTYKDIDRGIIEQFGPFNLIFLLKKFLLQIKTFQSGLLIDYIFYLVLFFVLIIFYFLIFSYFFFSFELLIIIFLIIFFY